MLTVKEVSERLGLSPALVYREIREGRLVAHCFGQRALRVSEENLGRYIEKSRVDGGSSAPDRHSSEVGARESDRESEFVHLRVSRPLSRRR